MVAGHRHDCTAECLPEGNWLVVGSLVRAQMVRDVGGWRDFTWSEDWDLWLRCWLAGATVEAIPDAIYRAYVRPNSRNRAPQHAERIAAHRAWMIRAYALGQGAGTQVILMLPLTLIAGAPTYFLRDVLMTCAWGLNIVLAEWIVRRRLPAAAGTTIVGAAWHASGPGVDRSELMRTLR